MAAFPNRKVRTMKNKIIRKNLATFISAAVSAYQSAGEQMHIAAISAIHNTATSGDVTLLNVVYEGLRSNDQQALKLYIRRATIVSGLSLTNGPDTVESLPTETMQEM